MPDTITTWLHGKRYVSFVLPDQARHKNVEACGGVVRWDMTRYKWVGYMSEAEYARWVLEKEFGTCPK